MKIGTTPTHSFQIPIIAELIKDVEITYCQAGNIVLQKYAEDCTIDGNSISVTLTQEDTFKFNHKDPVEIQVRILNQLDAVFASNIMTVSADRCLSKDVLV